MADYKRSLDGAIVRTRDGATVPDDPRNPDWRDYQAWRAAGNQPDPPPPAPPPARDLAAEVDALKAKLARAEAAEAVLIEKGTVTKGEIDAKLPARETGDIEAAKP